MTLAQIGVVRCQVILPRVNGLGRDAVTNTLHFLKGAGSLQAQADAIGPLVEAFYNTAAAPAYLPLRQLMSDQLSRTTNSCTMKFDDAAAAGDAPVLRQWTLGDSNSGTWVDLPGELAICLSLRGPQWHQRWQRGRLYLGPLLSRVMTDGGTAGDPQVTTEARNALVQSGKKLAQDSVAAGHGWLICSYTHQDAVSVVEGFVDDAFDVQRRRGIRPIARTSAGYIP